MTGSKNSQSIHQRLEHLLYPIYPIEVISKIPNRDHRLIKLVKLYVILNQSIDVIPIKLYLIMNIQRVSPLEAYSGVIKSRDQRTSSVSTRDQRASSKSNIPSRGYVHYIQQILEILSNPVKLYSITNWSIQVIPDIGYMQN